MKPLCLHCGEHPVTSGKLYCSKACDFAARAVSEDRKAKLRPAPRHPWRTARLPARPDAPAFEPKTKAVYIGNLRKLVGA